MSGYHSSVGKESTCNAGDPSSNPWVRKIPGEEKGSSLHYSGLENSKDRGSWQATVDGVAKSQTQLSNFHTHTYQQTTLMILKEPSKEFIHIGTFNSK